MAQGSRRGHRAGHIIRREFAERYILFAIISFAGSVSVTRLFLSLSGYPQLGGGELHIAHVLWGGLLLFVAALLPLIFANQWVYSVGALLGGVGVGLFIDEVGKFITHDNDYFFPAAAPIVYVFFLLTVLVLIQIKVIRDANRYADLHKALDTIHEMLEHPVSPKEKVILLQQIEFLMQYEPPGKRLNLAKSIREFLEPDDDEDSEQDLSQPKWKETIEKIYGVAWIFIQKNIRAILIIGTIAIGLLNLKNPVSEFFSPALPPEVVEMLKVHSGRQTSPEEAMGLYRFRVLSETIVGSLLILSAIILATRYKFVGTLMGMVSLLLCLLGVDLVLFYFEQFSTIMTTSVQFILLIGYLYFVSTLTSKSKRKAIPAGVG